MAKKPIEHDPWKNPFPSSGRQGPGYDAIYESRLPNPPKGYVTVPVPSYEGGAATTVSRRRAAEEERKRTLTNYQTNFEGGLADRSALYTKASAGIDPSLNPFVVGQRKAQAEASSSRSSSSRSTSGSRTRSSSRSAPTNVRYQQGTAGVSGRSSGGGTAGTSGKSSSGTSGKSSPGTATKGKTGTSGTSGTKGKTGTSGTSGKAGKAGTSSVSISNLKLSGGGTGTARITINGKTTTFKY